MGSYTASSREDHTGRVADGNLPAVTHLFDGYMYPCDFSHVRQRQSDESATSIFEQSMNNLQKT